MQRAGRCWASRCCHEASLPPKLGLRNLATFSPGALSPHRLARASPLPSPLGNSMEDRAGTRVGPGWPGAQSVSPSVPLRGAEMKIKPRSSSPLLPEEKPAPGSGLRREAGSPSAALPVLPRLQERQIRSNAGPRPGPEVTGSAPTPRGARASPRSKSLQISTCHPSPGMCSLTNLFAMKAGMDHLLFFFSKQGSSCTERNGGKLPLTQACRSAP